MDNFEKLENMLYLAKYDINPKMDYNKIWNYIKNNDNILKEATKKVKDKFGINDTVKGLAICESILIDYTSINDEIYNSLIDLIYLNEQIARIVLNGYSNGGYSFLLLTLINENLNLTENQKKFAIKEAMNKIGTSKYYEYKINEKTYDDETIITYIGDSLNPISKKTAKEYYDFIFSSMSTTQAHGKGAFDIRYYILRNHNWTDEEKRRLVYDFYFKDEDYYNAIDEWELNIVNDIYSCKDDSNIFEIDEFYLYDYTYQYFLNLYDDCKIASYIYEEIQFIKKIISMRKIAA